MSGFVLDASVVMAWCFEDEQSRYADGVLEQLRSNSALVPQLWLLEVGNVLVTAGRRNRISKKNRHRFLNLLSTLPIEVAQWLDLTTTRSLVAPADEHGLSAYDAHYLWLAMEEDLPLATLDQTLRSTANETGVMIFSEE